MADRHYTVPSELGDVLPDQIPALKGVLARLYSNRVRWGVQELTPHQWLSVLTEEVGEAAKEANAATWTLPDQTEREQAARLVNSLINLRHELEDVAAVAVAAIENVERLIRART